MGVAVRVGGGVDVGVWGGGVGVGGSAVFRMISSPGKMKELIVDRGYISGPFVGTLKQTHKVDLLIPLRRSMSDFQFAFTIAKRKNAWVTTELEKHEDGRVIKRTETTWL